MNFNLSDIQVYCLSNSKYEERRKNIIKMCEQLNMNVTFIKSDTNTYSRQRNIAHDTVDLIYLAIHKSNYPFLIMEDDATIIDNIPQNIKIPEEADLIYWGSNFKSGEPIGIESIFLSEHDDSYYRLYNSQICYIF